MNSISKFLLSLFIVLTLLGCQKPGGYAESAVGITEYHVRAIKNACGIGNWYKITAFKKDSVTGYCKDGTYVTAVVEYPAFPF